jgi:hypothetical protein
MKKLVAFVMIAFLVPVTATVALAKNPCKEDKIKFCKDAKAAGKGKLTECLTEHKAELAPACKEWLDKPKEAREKDKEARKEKKAKKEEAKPAGDKPAEAKTDDKPADGGATGGATAPSEPAAPGGAEDKQ